MEYYGKSAYHGDVVKNYERDRIVESIWEKEQSWVSGYIKNVPENSSILDLPVGTGRFLPIFAEKELKVFGIDISNDMIEQSISQLESLEKNKAEISLRVSDAEHIDLADNSIDYVICFRLFHLIPFEVIIKIIAEFYRVAKKEVVIQVFNSSLNIPAPVKKRTLKSLFLAIKRRIALPKKVEPEPQSQVTAWSHISNFSYDYSRLYNQFELTGFKHIKVEAIQDIENPSTVFTLSK